MILRLVHRCSGSFSVDFGQQQLAVLERLVSTLGRPDWSFDLVLVDDPVMADLNDRFRSKDGVTDVLSFSNLMDEGGGACDLARNQGGAYTDLWMDGFVRSGDSTEDFLIGEVILAPSFVKSRCLENQWSVADEFALLVVHGCLHLLGWDHGEKAQTEGMQNLEEKLLKACGLPHPLRNEGRSNA